MCYDHVLDVLGNSFDLESDDGVVVGFESENDNLLCDEVEIGMEIESKIDDDYGVDFGIESGVGGYLGHIFRIHHLLEILHFEIAFDLQSFGVLGPR